MPISFNSVLGNHEAALMLRARRSEILAANLANADTPNYKARDLDFKSALGQAMGTTEKLATTQPDHIQPADLSSVDGGLLYRVPSQPSLDGNTVDVQVEQAKFADNAVRYQATLEILGGRFKSLISAFRGN